MADHILSLLKKFIANDQLSIDELKYLRDHLKDFQNRKEINAWMHEQWELTAEVESELTFEQLVAQIDNKYKHLEGSVFWNRKAVKYFQRVAAILVLPLLAVAAYYYFNVENIQAQYAEAIVPKGQKSEIILPDNTHIWLNSDTRLKYPAEFGSGTRDIFLTGEAYFEVTPNKHKPFIVHAPQVDVKVLGTKFNVRAYADDQDVETALLSGKVDLSVEKGGGENTRLSMKPGELVDYSKKDHSIQKSGFDADEIIGWKNNRLIFRDDTFDKLVKKIERWYNVQIIYDKTKFQNQRLTVELREGESIERLFKIIEKAINVNYRIDKQKIYINPKNMKS